MKDNRCPKCRERNPPNAVLCWSCFTPLVSDDPIVPASSSGKTKAASGPERGAKPASAARTKSGRQLDSRWIAAAGALVFVLPMVFASFKILDRADNGADDTEGNSTSSTGANASGTGYYLAFMTPTPDAAAPTVTYDADPTTGGTVPPVAQIPYTVVASPNPKIDFGVMGILPRQLTSNPRQAAGIAAFARRQFVDIARWKMMDIYVFDDCDAAQRFGSYQSRRSGYPLGPNDYVALVPVWQYTPALYRYDTLHEALVCPAEAPDSWWQVAKHPS